MRQEATREKENETMKSDDCERPKRKEEKHKKKKKRKEKGTVLSRDAKKTCTRSQIVLEVIGKVTGNE